MPMRYETIAKFKSKRGGEVYFVKRKMKTGEFSCNCPGWIYSRHCKHIDYVKENPLIEIIDIPAYQEACQMAWGKDKQAKEQWIMEHLKEIEI